MSSVTLAQIPAMPAAPPKRGPRLESLDVLRGLVIAVMAIDHVRDYLSASAGIFDPTDLTRATPALFLTRWITHFCAPIFVFLAGLGSYLATQRGRTASQVSWFLLTRGLWLILLEVLVITPLGWSFQLDLALIRLQVIWVIGLSMILLSALCRFEATAVGLFGVAMIGAHNLLDGSKEPVWRLLHGITFHEPLPGHRVASLYPLIPWVGVLMAGFGAGQWWSWSERDRRGWLIRAGVGAWLLFVGLRLANAYGEPSPWAAQPDAFRTFLSFINVSKYPPSLDYLLITLGGGALALAWLEAGQFRWTTPFRVLGRVPLFFYLLHLPLIHGIAIGLAHLEHGTADWLWQDPFLLRRPPHAAPLGYGYGLPVIYVVWLAVMGILYPFCRTYADFKSRQQHPRWSYL